MNFKEDKDLNEKMVEELEKSLKEAKEKGELERAGRLKSMLDRLKNEYVPDVWEEIDETKRNKTSYRRQALDRILGILQEVPSDSKNIPDKETERER